MEVTRRNFLKHSLGATAACGLARLGVASEKVSATESIVDTHVYLGHWPHRQLLGDDPAKLVAELRRAGIGRAWTGSFDGLFHKDIAGVNLRLADVCTKVGDGMLVPFGTINPVLPDWEDDIRRCHETFHMPGIRLHPNYHGYTLDDLRFARVLELATARGLIVQLVAWMDAERHVLLNPHEPEVDLALLAEKITSLPRLKLVVSNCQSLPRGLLTSQQVYFDFAPMNDTGELKQLIDAASPERVVFGSGAPLRNVDATAAKLSELGLAREVRRKIDSANAAALSGSR